VERPVAPAVARDHPAAARTRSAFPLRPEAAAYPSGLGLFAAATGRTLDAVIRWVKRPVSAAKLRRSDVYPINVVNFVLIAVHVIVALCLF
jgi:hypothetical protein